MEATVSSVVSPVNSQLEVLPIGKKSEQLYDLRQHAVIGISPFNSYFTESNIINLLQWGLKNFNAITLFIPDKISCFTLRALGYPPEKADFKTKRQDSYLKNKVLRALEYFSIKNADAEKLILTYTELSSNPIYHKIYQEYLKKFNEDNEFRQSCYSTSSWILTNSPKARVLEENDLNIAVNYFLYEFPLFINTPAILGVETSVFIYHKVPEYLRYLYLNEYLVSPCQGFVQVCPKL